MRLLRGSERDLVVIFLEVLVKSHRIPVQESNLIEVPATMRPPESLQGGTMAQKSVSEVWKDVWPEIRPLFIKYSALLSLALIVINVIVFFALSFESQWAVLVNIFLVIAILIFSFIRASWIVVEERHRKYSDEWKAQEWAWEMAGLAKIRESMTDAERAMYEVQLENQELLMEIKNKKHLQTTRLSGLGA
jgi:hypothetical protein